MFWLVIQAAKAQEFSIRCKVVGISDGDTLTCLHQKRELKVRLLYIDAPESAQPFGHKAKQALASLVFKKEVKLHLSGQDQYKRLLAVVFDGNRNVNLALVEQGMAWAYRQTQPIYQHAQHVAEGRKLGLWQDKFPVNPAEWRASKRAETEPFLQKKEEISPLNHSLCQVKKSCNQIADYATAQRYFKQCGWKELDGNNDGIPCNKLYRKAQQR